MSKSFQNSHKCKNPSPNSKFSAIKSIKPSQKSKSSSSKPPLVSNTPNFGRNVYYSENPEPKLEESLDISEITNKEKFLHNFPTPFLPEENLSTFSKPAIHNSIQSHLAKYDQAFHLLTSNFKKFQSDTDEHFLSIHENLATLKNSIKVHSKFKENLEKFIKRKTKQAVSLLSQEFSTVCKEITNNEKYSKDNIEKLHHMQDYYDQKLQENEEYLQSFENIKKSEQTRSKSSINHYFSSLAEENKRLRADLSKLWNKS